MDDTAITQLGLTVVYGAVGVLLTLTERVESSRALRLWSLTLYLFSLDALASALGIILGLSAYTRAVSWLALTAAAAMGVAGIVVFIGRPLPKGLFVLGGVGALITVGGMSLGVDPDWIRFVVFWCMAVSFAWAARLTFEIGMAPGVGRWVGCSAFMAAAIYAGSWPMVCKSPAIVRLEFYLDLSVVIWGAAGVVLIHFERSRERVRQLAAQELKLRAQLEQSERLEALGRLAGGVAHDFNNVLTTVIHGSELALKQLSDRPKTADHVAMVLEAAQGAAGFTRQLLALGRRRLPGRKPVLVDEAIRGAMALVRPALLPNHVLVCPPVDPACAVLAGEGQLEQVIVNLSLNAIYAMAEGGTLSVEVRVDPERVVLTVRDSGCGMDAATLSRVFEPFFSTRTAKGGTGLGLAAVYAIVKQLDGHIHAESTPGLGSKFVVDLPRSFRAPASLPAATDRSRTPSDLRILVVDDQDAVLKSVAAGLAHEGYRVVTARDAEEALLKLSSEPPQLLLADVRMPGKSGPQLAADVRAQCPNLPVILMTGHADDDEVDSGRCGAVWLFKPFTPQKLLSAIDTALSLHR